LLETQFITSQSQLLSKPLVVGIQNPSYKELASNIDQFHTHNAENRTTVDKAQSMALTWSRLIL